jgi:tetratricopeptide (TPR) repeat protein
MAIAASQLSSFYSYRYFVPPSKGFGQPSKDATEQQVRAKVSEGDAAFALRKYAQALNAYLEAYGLLHRFLHPQFPVEAVLVNPNILSKVDIFKPLISVAIQTARFREKAGSLPIAIAVDLPQAFMQTLEANWTGTKAPMGAAELAYHGATSYLQMGAADEASKLLKFSQRRAQTQLLKAHIASATAAVHIANGEIDNAQRLLKNARTQYAEAKSAASVAAVDNNTGVLFSISGDARRAGEAFQAAGDTLPKTMGRTLTQNLNPGTASTMIRPMGVAGMSMLVPSVEGSWIQIAPGAASGTIAAKEIRVQAADGVHTVALGDDAETRLIETIYQPRIAATSIGALHPHLEVAANIVAYIPHMYGFVLPMDIGDCYMALGQRPTAVDYYLKALDYPFLNRNIEAPSVWLKAARAIVAEADSHYRRGDADTARDWYERVLRSDSTVPVTSRLYQGAHFTPLRTTVSDIITAIDADAVFAGNHEIAALVSYVRGQLAKILAGLNWIGLAEDVVPIWTFDFLQATSRYFATHAVQAWREYISYRAAAEQAEMTEREMEQAVTMSWYSVQTHLAQEELARRQRDVATALRDSAALHRDNLVAQRNQFNTDGWVIAELNRFQAWYGNASSDVTFDQSVRWDWGGGRSLEVGAGSLQERVDAVVAYRNRLSHQMQIDNFNRQIAEANSQITVANRQVDVANAQETVARWNRWAAERQLEFAQDNLEFFRSREFNPDMWHALADRMREVANQYLEMGIYAAFLMERAYEVENDRELHRIRFDYASPGIGELTAGDSLLTDIDSFSYDVLVHSKGKRNRVRYVVSLSDFAPQAFIEFLRTGRLEFTIPLDAIERVFPGTYLHRIQSVEVEIEGLQVPEGISGTLTHMGISSWRGGDGTVKSRVTAPETMILSGFRLRRDLVLYRADPNRLGLFENSGVAASWGLEVPPDTNDVDYMSISDLRLVIYLYCLHDPGLEATIRATFPASGEAAQSFSARLHAPDQYFAFGPPPDGASTITFVLDPRIFPYNQLNLRSTQVGVQVLRTSASGRAEPAPGLAVTVSMAGVSGAAVTDAEGLVASDGAGSPLDVLVNQPVGDVSIEFTGPPEDRAQVADVFLLLNYQFDYR